MDLNSHTILVYDFVDTFEIFECLASYGNVSIKIESYDE